MTIPDLSRFPHCIAVLPDATVLWWDGTEPWEWDNSVEYWSKPPELRDAWARYTAAHPISYHKDGGWKARPQPGIYFAVPVERECETCLGRGYLVYDECEAVKCKASCNGGKTSRTEIRREEPTPHPFDEQLNAPEAIKAWWDINMVCTKGEMQTTALFLYDDAQPPGCVMVTRKDVE